jgi:3'(2'), 5'-bisphosphate nucleotidase
MKLSDFDNVFQKAVQAAIDAGKVIMEHYQGELHPEKKRDGSPVTEADRASSEVIRRILEQTNIPIIDEEIKNSDYQTRRDWPKCWVVDPLDGTMEYIKKNDEFSVNIALVENNEPVFGLISSPVQEYMMFGGPEHGIFEWHYGTNSEILKVAVNNRPTGKFTVISSRNHKTGDVQKFCENLQKSKGNVELMQRGSALKFFELIKNQAQCYPRFGPTMEWDIAAGHALLRAAGGKVYNVITQRDLTYNKTNLVNPYFFALSYNDQA